MQRVGALLLLLVCVGCSLQQSQVEWIYSSSASSCNGCAAGDGDPFLSFVCSNETKPASVSPKTASPRSHLRSPRASPPLVVSHWDAGRLGFFDPIPAQTPAVIRRVNVTIEGRYNCGIRCQPADYILLLNLVSVASGTFPSFPNASCGCHCGNCGFPVTLSTGLQQGSGWTAYNRGAENYLQVYLPPFFHQLVVCLSRVSMTIEWENAVDTPLALAFEPHLGPKGGSTLVNVSGFNFDSEAQYQCVFGGQQAVPGFVLSPVVVQCLSPPWPSALDEATTESGFTPVDFVLQLGTERISNFTDRFLYYNQPQIDRLEPAAGNYSESTQVHVLGSGFISTLVLMCKFGDYPPRAAHFLSTTELVCTSPPWQKGTSTVVAVEISENGQDFTDDQITFTFNGVPVLGSLQLWQLILVIAGSVVVLALLITIVAVCLYRRARSHDKQRRFLDASDSEDETEPLISAIQSQSLRKVLAKVERVDVSDLKIDRRIGRGSFGEVYHAFWSGTEIALKKLPKHMLSNQKLLEDFAQEINILAGLRHPNVLQFLGVAVDKVSLYMLTEFMDRGSLYDVLHDPKRELPMSLILRMLIDTSRGMSYLHKRLIHRDLKSHNLLVDSHWVVKICDFGLSRLKKESNTLTACGTPCWTAPEVLRNEYYTEKADVYSFGIVIWECLTREDPFAGMPPFHVVFVVGSQGARPDVPPCKPEWPQELLDLMVHAWQEDPEIRPSFPEIIVSLQEIARNWENAMSGHTSSSSSLASSPMADVASSSVPASSPAARNTPPLAASPLQKMGGAIN